MTLSKFQKQLAKDIKKSPAKAAALGGLFLVALYAWAPLLVNFGKQDASKKKTQITTAMPASPVADSVLSSQVADGAPRVGLKTPWEQLATWIDRDPYMAPASQGLNMNNPFSRSEPIAEVAEASPADDPRLPMTTDKAARPDFILSSTMLGKQRRVAVINGRPYAEGLRIRIGPGAAFTLVEVGSRHVVLERGGQRFNLTIRDENALAAAEDADTQQP